MTHQPDLSSLDYLEAPLPLNSLSPEADKSLLQEADKYYINFEGLEDGLPAASPANDSMDKHPAQFVADNSPQAAASSPSSSPDYTFADVFIPLPELIEKFFRRSSHPVVVVSDDKIVYCNTSFLKLVDANSEADV